MSKSKDLESYIAERKRLVEVDRFWKTEDNVQRHIQYLNDMIDKAAMHLGYIVIDEETITEDIEK